MPRNRVSTVTVTVLSVPVFASLSWGSRHQNRVDPTAGHGVDGRRQLARDLRPDPQGQPPPGFLGEGRLDGLLRQQEVGLRRSGLLVAPPRLTCY